MPQLPTTDVYGNRASIRSNRIDRPATGNLDLAQNLEASVASFNEALNQNREKKRNLNYTLARNEILMADLNERNKLAEDRDWKTHDQRYSEAFNQNAERIRSAYDLDPYDAQVLDAESRMILAKGRVDVGARAKGLEVDQGYAALMASIDVAREQVLTAKAGDRVALMEGVMESIDVAEEQGYFGIEGATAAELQRQKTTQEFAMAVINSMDAAEREMVLRATMAYRRGYGVGEYAEFIQSASAKYGVPPELIAAQINRESSGDPNAKSGAFGDPTGLMQLGEDAAKDMGVTDRTDPAQNIDGGTKYNAAMLERFDGDKAKALAAFNMGPGKLEKIIAEHGDGWFEYISTTEFDPNLETMKYVNKLLPYWEGTAPPDKYMLATNTGQGPLTREDIAAGKGTGSVADFLHTDTVAKMLESSSKENKENTERSQAQSLIDAAYSLFPNDHAARQKFIRNASDGNVRKKAETDLELRNNQEVAEKNRQAAEVWKEYSGKIRELKDSDSPITMADIQPEHLELMSESQIRDLEAAIERASLDAQWAPVTRTFSKDPEQKTLQMWMDMPAFGPGSKMEADLDGDDWRGALDQQDWMEADALQRQLKALDGADLPLKNHAPLVKTVLKSISYGGETLDSAEKGEMEARLKLMLDARVSRWQNANNREATYNDVNGILSDLMMEKAYYKDQYLWGTLVKSKPTEFDLATMTDAEMAKGYLPVEDAKKELYTGTNKKYQGLNTYEILKAESKELEGVPPEGASDEAIARAYFAHKAGLGTAAVNARLRGM